MFPLNDHEIHGCSRVHLHVCMYRIRTQVWSSPAKYWLSDNLNRVLPRRRTLEDCLRKIKTRKYSNGQFILRVFVNTDGDYCTPLKRAFAFNNNSKKKLLNFKRVFRYFLLGCFVTRVAPVFIFRPFPIFERV